MDYKKEYIVITKEGIDISKIDKEIKSKRGSNTIPNRKCMVANAKTKNNRITHFFLTDGEAKILREDERILDVHLKPKLGRAILAEQEANFSRTGDISSGKINWGLKRHTQEIVDVDSQANPYNTEYKYNLTGKGVDVVIQDDGIEVDHPEFIKDNGISRVKQIDWYVEAGVNGTMPAKFYDTTTSDRNYNGGQHGTMVASVVAGKTYGWAKEANIYSMRIFGGSDHEIDYADSFDLIRLWHERKPVNPETGVRRPTIVNQSWGFAYYYDNQPSANPSIQNIFYKGVDQGLDGGVSRDVTKGMVFSAHPISVTSVNVEQQQLTDAGVICIHAAGNSYHSQASEFPEYNDPVYDSYYTRNDTWAGMIPAGDPIYYNRAMSPNSRDTITVGQMQSAINGLVEVAGKKSERGKIIDVWAAGSDVVAATSKSSQDPTTSPYPFDSTRNIASMSGSSIATPQVSGVACLLAQMHPSITPSQCKNFIKSKSQRLMYDTLASEDWSDGNSNDSLYGATQEVLYWPYGSGNNITVSGTATTVSTNFS